MRFYKVPPLRVRYVMELTGNLRSVIIWNFSKELRTIAFSWENGNGNLDEFPELLLADNKEEGIEPLMFNEFLVHHSIFVPNIRIHFILIVSLKF